MSTEPQGVTSKELFDYLAGLGITVKTWEHPPLFTVSQSQGLRDRFSEWNSDGHSKNLFLRNKRGAMWLCVVEENRKLDMKGLEKLLGSPRLSFGSPERLKDHLGILPGSVSPFALINDKEGRVPCLLDKNLLECPTLYFHPLDNRFTTAIASKDLIRFLESVQHSPTIVDLENYTSVTA